MASSGLEQWPRQEVEPRVECWDDDQDLQDIGSLHFRNFSTTTVGTNFSSKVPNLLDPLSSRLSFRSELEDDGDWQLTLPNDDDMSTRYAIDKAKIRGIPLPTGIPPSALVGGTIRRLGVSQIKKPVGDDWTEDIELPPTHDGAWQLKSRDAAEFPDVLQNVSLNTPPALSPSRMTMEHKTTDPTEVDKYANLAPGPEMQTCFKRQDTESIPYKTDGQANTIRISTRPLQSWQMLQLDPEEDSGGLEIPVGGELTLISRGQPSLSKATRRHFEDRDVDITDGTQAPTSSSYGSRRTGRSNRSSSVSALSPSVFSPSLSSCLTVESEDEGLEGLVLPNGPLQFDEVLKKRMLASSPEPADSAKIETAPKVEDFFSGIELGDGDVFDSRKSTLNRNIIQKSNRQTSPTRRQATTLTFTNKVAQVNTRIPKPTAFERPRPKLDPVSENTLQAPAYKKKPALVMGHTQSSVASGIPALIPTAASDYPSTPSRGTLRARASREVLTTESTRSQLLKTKRSMPILNSRSSTLTSGSSQASLFRPSSRLDKDLQSVASCRPKSPLDRLGPDSKLTQSRKPPNSLYSSANVVSHNPQARSDAARATHRPTLSDPTSNENNPAPHRSLSRLSSMRPRSNTPTSRKDLASESLVRAAASKRTITRPTRRQAFGDGTELDAFDDLPTSTSAESRFLKQPATLASKRPSAVKIKSVSTQDHVLASSRGEGVHRVPLSPQKRDTNVPSWARDTAASRLAREQRAASTTAPTRNPGVQNTGKPSSINWKAHVNVKSSAQARATSAKAKRPQQGPHLIKPLGHEVNEARNIKGMAWNPHLFRWEGNENALAPFDTPSSPKHSGVVHLNKPALIANVGATKGVQVVGGMVFDPQRMCWLKIGSNITGRGRNGSGAASLTTEDEEDPFAGLDDLEDDTKSRPDASTKYGGSDDDWMVGEEFDVGPDFMRRQKNEEERWRRRLDGWARLLRLSTDLVYERSDIRQLIR